VSSHEHSVKGIITALSFKSLTWVLHRVELIFCWMPMYPHSLYFWCMRQSVNNVHSLFWVLGFQTKGEGPIRRSNPFPHSMKPAKVDIAASQKWVAWILFTPQEESISTIVIGVLWVDTNRCIYDTEIVVYGILLWNYRKYSISYKKISEK
jgi:hypothetical protein